MMFYMWKSIVKSIKKRTSFYADVVHSIDFGWNRVPVIIYYIQSAYSLPDETKRTQEIRPFRKIDDSFKKIVITKDIVQPYYDDYGILTVNIYDFLLDPQILEK